MLSSSACRHARRGAAPGRPSIASSGSAVDVADLTARLRLRGHGRAVVVLTRVADRPWALVCTEER